MAMSRQDVETVRATWESFNRTHRPDFDALHPDVRWHTRSDLPDSDTHHGHDGVARLASDWVGSFDDLRVEAEELIDAGDRVVAVLRLRGRLKGSGQEVEMPEAHAYTLLNDKLVEVHEFATKAAALEAVGIATGA
jgi:ketosteroid isomerase-like protein